MPNFTGSVSEGQIVALIAYIKSLTTDQDQETPTASPKSSSESSGG
jgi:hypothetical protein